MAEKERQKKNGKDKGNMQSKEVEAKPDKQNAASRRQDKTGSSTGKQ